MKKAGEVYDLFDNIYGNKKMSEWSLNQDEVLTDVLNFTTKFSNEMFVVELTKYDNGKNGERYMEFIIRVFGKPSECLEVYVEI